VSLVSLEFAEPVSIRAIAVGVAMFELWTSHLYHVYIAASRAAPSWHIICVTVAIVSSLVYGLFFALFVALRPPVIPVVRRVAELCPRVKMHVVDGESVVRTV